MPSDRWSDKQIEDVLRHMADGMPISHIERIAGMPSADTMERWEAAGDELAGNIARARTRGYHKRAADAVERASMADDAAKGRLAFDAERWFLSKMAPRVYGDKLDVTSGGEKIDWGSRALQARDRAGSGE